MMFVLSGDAVDYTQCRIYVLPLVSATAVNLSGVRMSGFLFVLKHNFYIFYAQVIYSRGTGQSRGYEFVTMSTVEEAELAVEMFDGFVSTFDK